MSNPKHTTRTSYFSLGYNTNDAAYTLSSQINNKPMLQPITPLNLASGNESSKSSKQSKRCLHTDNQVRASTLRGIQPNVPFGFPARRHVVNIERKPAARGDVPFQRWNALKRGKGAGRWSRGAKVAGGQRFVCVWCDVDDAWCVSGEIFGTMAKRRGRLGSRWGQNVGVFHESHAARDKATAFEETKHEGTLASGPLIARSYPSRH